jgi:excisionase family DNA binding protein
MTLIEKIASIDHAMTVSELSNYIHLGHTAIYNLVARRAIPHFRIGYSVRFDPQQIAAWLRERAVR